MPSPASQSLSDQHPLTTQPLSGALWRALYARHWPRAWLRKAEAAITAAAAAGPAAETWRGAYQRASEEHKGGFIKGCVCMHEFSIFDFDSMHACT